MNNPFFKYGVTTITIPTSVQPTIGEVVRHQSKLNPDGTSGFVCPNCKHHKGGIGCKMNMFIAFTGAYTQDCKSFEEK